MLVFQIRTGKNMATNPVEFDKVHGRLNQPEKLKYAMLNKDQKNALQIFDNLLAENYKKSSDERLIYLRSFLASVRGDSENQRSVMATYNFNYKDLEAMVQIYEALGKRESYKGRKAEGNFLEMQNRLMGWDLKCMAKIASTLYSQDNTGSFKVLKDIATPIYEKYSPTLMERIGRGEYSG